MQITFVFWNIHKRPEAFESLVRLASEYCVHVLLVAEMPYPGEPGLQETPATVLLDALNQSVPVSGLPKFTLQSTALIEQRESDADIVQVYSRLPAGTQWERESKHNRYSLWKVQVPEHRLFHLAAAHFTSIQNDQGDGQRECAAALRIDLEQAEKQSFLDGDADTSLDPLSLVIGDLNANPFDPGIVSIYGLNATGLRTTALEGKRKHQGRTYSYLYNPMWRFLNSEQPGSFYAKSDAPIRFDWFLLDQVLVRPGFIELFDKNRDMEPDLRLLTNDGEIELTEEANKAPIKGISDHLPLMFRFQLPQRRNTTDG